MKHSAIFAYTCSQCPFEVKIVIKLALVCGEHFQETWTTEKEATVTHPHFDAHPN